MEHWSLSFFTSDFPYSLFYLIAMTIMSLPNQYMQFLLESESIINKNVFHYPWHGLVHRSSSCYCVCLEKHGKSEINYKPPDNNSEVTHKIHSNNEHLVFVKNFLLKVLSWLSSSSSF